MTTRARASAGEWAGEGPRPWRRRMPRPSGGSPTARRADAGRLFPLPWAGGCSPLRASSAPRWPISAGGPSNGADGFFRRERAPSRALLRRVCDSRTNRARPRLRPPTANPLAPIRLDGADWWPGGFIFVLVKICLTANSRTDRELYSTKVQQPARATTILSSHQHADYAAPMPSQRERANGLQTDVMTRYRFGKVSGIPRRKCQELSSAWLRVASITGTRPAS